jgi:16S rRNA (cytidine1402-2'-O)-methyltransferase
VRGVPLYICPTPIGNLEDITLRVLRTLNEVHYIAAEDTRHTGKLLKHYQIETPLISYHEHNKVMRGQEILAICGEGQDVALVSDAGTPGISDPGWELIRDAIEAGVQVISLPGPTALITALVASGLQTSSFVFQGFLPRKSKDRQEHIRELISEERTIILYEAPHRFLDTLKDIFDILGERHICVARELTKIHEEFYRGTLSQAIEEFSETPKGEMVLILEGASRQTPVPEESLLEGRMDEALVEAVDGLLREGMSVKDATREVAREFNLSRRQVYNIYHRATEN